jgi:hypothetical protein
MKAASLKEIQTELENIPNPELLGICLRLARFKKENKELITYLLFESFDEQAYIEQVKKDISEQFAEINTSSLYFVKKSARKILRMIAKYCRYTGSAVVEVQLLLHFCNCLKTCGIAFTESPVLLNLYQNQFKKIEKSLATMHEDLQYDYIKELAPLKLK